MALTPPQYKQMKQFLESDQRNKKFSLLQDDLEPGPLKDELLKDFDPSQETYEEYLRRKNLERPFNMAEGGRIGFRYGSIPEALNQLISEGKTNFESISALKNEIEKITGKRPGGSFQIYKYPLLEKFTFEKFKTKKKYKPEEYVVKDQKKLTKQIKKLNKKYKLNNKGINVKQILTSTGRPALEIQANAQVYGQVGRQAPPSIDGFNDIESELKKITKTDTFKNYDKSAAMKKGGEKAAAKMISPNKKPVFDYVLKNPNSTVDQITKALDLKKGVVTKTLQDLYVDMYKRLGDEGAVYFKQFDSKDIVSVADSIKNMNVDLKDRVKQLVTDAYKGDKNLKPLLKKISDFYSLQSEIKKTSYGKFFAGNLDHTIPLTFIRQLDEGADPMNLIRVKPMPEYLNQRAFKSQFDRVLGQAYATKNKKALEAIVNLQSYLPKEFGGITPDGKIKDYGAKPFSLKTNLSQADFPEIYKRVFEFIENPKLQETFKQSKVSFKKLLSQKKQITAASDQFKKLVATLSKDPRCRLNRFKGGRVGLQDGSASLDICFRQGVDNINRGLPNPTAAQARNFGRVAALGRNVVKFGVLPEALFVAGESVIRAGMGDTLPEAILRASEYLLPGNQTKIADRMMLARTVGPKTAELILKANELRGFENQIENLENEKQFTGILTDDGFDDNFFGQTKVEEENAIQNQIDALKKRKESYKSLTEAQYNFADRKAQEAEDIKKSRALFPKLLAKARSVQPDFDDPLREGVQQTLDLNLKMLPSRFQRQTDLFYRSPDVQALVNTPDQQLSNLFKGQDLENIKQLKIDTKNQLAETVSEAAAINPEAMFSASTGLFAPPLDLGVSYTPPPIDSIDEMEKEIIGQTNVANPFDLDTSNVATGLRGFSAAGGGIAKLAGVDSGPPPSSGPNSQGLQGLMKRVRNR